MVSLGWLGSSARMQERHGRHANRLGRRERSFFVTAGTGGSGAFGVGGSTGRVTAGFSWLTGVGIVTKEISYAASGRSIFPGKRNPRDEKERENMKRGMRIRSSLSYFVRMKRVRTT